MGGPLAGQIAIFGAGTLPITWTRAVNHWFDARKGLALGISPMGTGIFGFFLKRFTTWLIGQLGWLGVFAGLGLLPLLIALPVALALFRDTNNRAAAPPRPIVMHGMTPCEALRDRRFLDDGVPAVA